MAGGLKLKFSIVLFALTVYTQRENCKMDQPFVKTYATLGYL